MKNVRNRYLLVIILLALTATIVNALHYDSTLDDTTGLAVLETIPLRIGEWQGYDLPLEESVYEILETRAIIHRNYINDKGQIVLLSIVYYNDTKVDFHAPEACLGGRGGKTTKTIKTLNLEINGERSPFEVAEIIASNTNSTGLSYYFYKAGDFIGQNYINLRLRLAKNSLFSGDKSGALIRLSGSYFRVEDRQELEITMQSLLEKLLPVILDDF